MGMRFDARSRALARTAFDVIEPFHVLVYFAPTITAAQADTGLDPQAWYVGSRGAPMGPCAAGVVAASFFSFSPRIVEPGWAAATGVGLDVVSKRRDLMLDDTLRTAVGDLAAADDTARLADRFAEIGQSVSMAGRPLASAWAQATPPSSPVVRLWYALAVLREWRGDGHLGVLVAQGFDRLESVVFHEATHPDPSAIPAKRLGKRMSQATRGWSDDDWDSALKSLVTRGLVEPRTPDTVGRDRLTDAGGRLYDEVEAQTDDAAAAAWAGDDAEDLIDQLRPYTAAVLASEMLPWTRTRRADSSDQSDR